MEKQINFFKKASTKFMMASTVPVIVLVFILSVVLFNELKNKAFTTYSIFAGSIANGISTNIIAWVEKVVQFEGVLAESDVVKKALLNPENSEALNDLRILLKSHVNDDPSFVDMAVVLLNSATNLDGTYIVSAIDNNLIGQDASGFDFIKEILNGKKYYIGGAFHSDVANTSIMPVCSPIYYEKELIGAVVINVNVPYFAATQIEGFDMGETVHIFITDERGRVLTHRDKSLILNKNIGDESENIVENIISGEKHFIHNFRGVKTHYFTGTNLAKLEFDRDSWYITVVTPEKAINNSAYSSLKLLIVSCAILVIIIIIGFNYLFKIIIRNPLNKITSSLQNITSGEGDLTQRLSVKSEDEFYILTYHYNKFVEEIANIVIRVKDIAESVSSASSQIASSMEETNKTVEEQTGQIMSIASSVEQLSVSGSAEKDIVFEAKEKATIGRDKTYEGGKKLETVIKMVDIVEENSSDLSRTINGLTNSTSKIDSILNVINDISHQTNLLALNAAIEAARAGEAGRGFAVVADEIKKLAERTTKSTTEISDIIDNIEDEVRVVDTHMKETSTSVNESKSTVGDTGLIFKDIVAIVDSVYEIASQIEVTATEQMDSLNRTNDNIQVISSASEETSRGVFEVTNTINSLQKELEGLKVVVDKFKV